MGTKSKLQLKEAHGKGSACIAWERQGKHVITGGGDGKVLVHTWDPLVPPSVKMTLKAHNSPVSCVAVSPNGSLLATASVDHSVKLYSYPGGDSLCTITRFTLPIRAIGFSSTGTLFAAAGDDDAIKLINTADNSITRVLKGHNAPVTSVAFDPRDEYIASMDSDGTVKLWIISSGKALHTVRVGPRADVAGTRNTLAWHPDGDFLAVPGPRGDIVLLERDTGIESFTLTGGHTSVVSSLSWSLNGRYLASAGLDKQIVLWDIEKREDIDGMLLDTVVQSLAWKPIDNGLAFINLEGKFSVWEAAVPPHMISPTICVKSRHAPAYVAEELHGFSEDEEPEGIPLGSQDTGNGDAENEDEEESDTEEFAVSRVKRPRNTLSVNAVYEKKSMKPVEKVRKTISAAQLPDMQAPFQPGSTDKIEGRRRFLAYNMIGSISSFDKEGSSHVEVEFHDISRGARIPALTDYFGFTMAALSERGSVFASPHSGEKNPSTLMYRPFNSWATNSEWSVRFPSNEEVKAVAAGNGWAAAVTSLHYLRVFSQGGLQRCVLSLCGPVVSMAAHHQLLAITYHSSRPISSGDQCLEFIVLDLQRQAKIASGRLALSPGSTLSWIGFSDSGLLGSYDSQGVLRLYAHEYGGSWIPIFRDDKERNSATESFWMVGFDDKQVFAVICKLPQTQPSVFPRPVLRQFNHSLPLVTPDFGGDDLENDYLRHSLLLCEARRKADKAAAEGQDVEQEDERILEMEVEHDKYVLRLLAAACKGNKLARAMELANNLEMQTSLEGAVKVVNAMRLPALAERLNLLLEKKFLSIDEPVPIVSKSSEKPSLLRNTLPLHKAKDVSTSATTTGKETTAENNDTLTPIISRSSKKATTPTSAGVPKVSNPFAKSPTSLAAGEIAQKVNKSAETTTATTNPSNPKAGNPFAKSPTSLAAGETVSATRKANNPFAKSASSSAVAGTSGSKPNVPLLDSLKMLQGNSKRKERE